jgi:hypothetical protein
MFKRRKYTFALAVIKPCRTMVRVGDGWEQEFFKGEFSAETVIEASSVEALVGRVVDGRHNEEVFISKAGALELLDVGDDLTL